MTSNRRKSSRRGHLESVFVSLRARDPHLSLAVLEASEILRCPPSPKCRKLIIGSAIEATPNDWAPSRKLKVVPCCVYNACGDVHWMPHSDRRTMYHSSR